MEGEEERGQKGGATVDEANKGFVAVLCTPLLVGVVRLCRSCEGVWLHCGDGP